jgi:hypothetical protein
VNISTSEEAVKWVSSFSDNTKTSWSIRESPSVTGQRVTYKKVFGCIHHGRGSKLSNDRNRGTRNTKCQAQMIITIFAVRSKKGNYKRKVIVDPKLPCEIYLRLAHNHPINASDVLRFRPVGAAVKDKLRALFLQGHTPATAQEVIKIDLMSENPDDYEALLADRQVCPDYHACYYLYVQEFEREYGPVNSRDHKFLTSKLEEYNKQCGEIPSAAWEFTTEGTIIVICTPLMRRVHRLTPEAAEVVFIDSSGTVDRDGHRIFLLLTHNESGGVPLGVMITTSESTAVISKALAMLKALIGTDAFFGSESGPSIFMTDDSASERNSLAAVWPQAMLLLCLFHVLQAIWRWLQQAKHGILKQDRVHLYRIFKSIIYSQTEDECCSNFDQLKSDQKAKKCNSFIDHISSR